MTLRKIFYLAAVPLMMTASCVPPQAGWRVAAAPETAPEAPADEALPPPSSLRPLAPEAKAQWDKAAGQFTAPSAAPALPFQHNGGEADRNRALSCLANAIYYEARSESDAGQRAVAQVVLNRARHPAFPASVCGVVYQGSQRRTGCQFSFTCDGSMRRRPFGGSWGKAREIAAAALAGEVYAPVGNATHYHTTAILPYWAPSLKRAAVIGAHIFYRWRGASGSSSAFRQQVSGNEGLRVASAAAPQVEIPAEADGAPAVKPVEYVRAPSGTVTIYRGAPSEAGEKAATFGVRVHRGTAAPAS